MNNRSDALMLASFNPLSMQVTLTSIARDSYVPIACYAGKSEDKITHARVRSRQCTIDTVEDLMVSILTFILKVTLQVSLRWLML